MATPYQFSRRIPVPPHTTPLSVISYKAPPKSKRPPIHNPYDKFTQPEFDAWIDNITGSLKRALGQIEADDESKAPQCKPEVAMTEYSPIEIVSSDEEEENEVELAIGANDENEEEEEEEEDYSEQQTEYSWKQGQSSSQQFFSPAKRAKYVQEDSGDSNEGSEGDEEGPIFIVSDDEDGMDDGDRGHQDWSTEDLEEGPEGFGEEYYEEEEPVRLGTSHLKSYTPRIRTSRDSRHFHYTDKEETEDGPEIVEDDDEIEEIQLPEANTAFQFQVRHSPAQTDNPIEIPDPWAGPRIDAEDHDKGDVRPSLDSNYLGDGDSYEGIQDITGDKLDGDGMQVAEQDTSYPLHDEEQQPVDIGPQTYTEDFYAGADVRAYSGQEMDPTLLVGDNISVPSTSQIVTLDGEDYEEDLIDEEQLEDEPEHDEEAVIQPPAQHTFAPTSRRARRALPIPANAEFISIDDSDEETGLEDQKPTAQEPPKVVEMEFQELQHDVDEQNIEREKSVEVDEIVKEDTAYVHKAIPPLGSAPPSEADISIVTWPLNSSEQRDGISMNYESLYADIEAVTVQPEEQAEVISTVDWNYPPAFPAGIPTSASGHLATPSEESNENVEDSVVQAMGTRITLELADKEISSDTLVHKEVITQPEKNLAKVLVENPETLVDQAIVEPPVVENSDPQSTSRTLAHVDDMVNNKRIAEHGEGVTAEGTAQAHKIEITLEDVTQLVDENESAPAQQSSEDDEIDIRGVDASMQETKIIAANTEDDISPSAEEIDEEMDNQTQPFASTSSVQNPVPVFHHHAHDYDQLPTPPPDRTPTAQSPSMANDGPSYTLTSPLKRHRVQIEEVEDEDEIRPQPFSADSVELDLRIDTESTGEQYSVVEPESNDEYTAENADADADGEFEFDVEEVVSMSNASQMRDEAQDKDEGMHLPNYVIEEPLPDGQLTEESTGLTFASMNSQALDELACVFSEIPNVSSIPVEELVSLPDADLLKDTGLSIDQAIEQIEEPLPIGAEAMHSAQPSENIHAKTLPVSINVTLTRKPTDPILVSDPYPYSLSTPGVSFMDPTDSEQDNSMSSNSTLENANSFLDTDEPELQYPPEPDILAELNVRPVATSEDASRVVDEAANVDAHGGFNSEPVVVCLPQSSAQVQQANLPTGDGTVAPSLINSIENVDVSPKEVLPIEPANGISSPLTETANYDLPEESTTPPNGIAGSSASTRASKRKRDSLPPHLEKAAPTSADEAEKGKNKKVSKLTGKGKAKATNEEVVDQGTSQATIHVKPRRKLQSRALPKNLFETWTADLSSSGARTPYKMLLPSSPSSVSSSVPSDQSVTVVTMPSPTIHKPNVPLVQSLQPVSLFHAHGQKRKEKSSQPQSTQARTHPIHPPMPSIQRVISLPRINDSGSTTAASPTTAISPTVVPPSPVTPTVIMKAVPSPPVRHIPAISSSPVTRSHCRYHRISLPKEEGGPRISFLVPGCSLNDRELMAEEEIEDHGDATHEESLRMIKDIQSLDFDSYLIGILRQLVGLDILREQEVFYLPQPGEVVRKTSLRKERSGMFRGADSSSYAGSPGGSMRSPGSMKAPTSLADSTSTSFSAFRRRLDSEKSSASVHSDTELEPSDGEPDAKRVRASPPDEQSPMGPPLKTKGKRQPRRRHSKQIEEVREGNSNDTQSRVVRKRPSNLGVKRRRDSEITEKDDDEEHLPKKLKIRTSAQQLGASTT